MPNNTRLQPDNISIVAMKRFLWQSSEWPLYRWAQRSVYEHHCGRWSLLCNFLFPVSSLHCPEHGRAKSSTWKILDCRCSI